MAWTNGGHTHVPTNVRNAMLQRDNNQCTATLQTGGRCPETTHLEAHEPDQTHQQRTPTLDDVVTLCHWHHNRITQAQAAQARRGKPNTSLKPAETHPAYRVKADPEPPPPF